MKQLIILSSLIFLSSQTIKAQEQPSVVKSNFFSDVRYGGNLGVSFGNGFSHIAIAPSAIKPLTPQVSVGAGLQFNYISSKNYYSSTSYGLSVLGLYNPIPEVQLSAEVEQLRVDRSLKAYSQNNIYYDRIDDQFWNTALFLGAGYSSGNATTGIRYNVLYKKDNFVYHEAWMPFVRVYF